jgi:uncharacterized Zn finger protein (UPF0148 family)
MRCDDCGWPDVERIGFLCVCPMCGSMPNVKLDYRMPKNEIHFTYDGKVVHRMTNIGEAK